MKFIILLFALLAFNSFSQEICDNGIDDDGDGLIDLNDTSECNCTGLIYNDSIFEPSLFPNSSFEEYIFCPLGISLMYVVVDWLQASISTTSDYMNSCGFIAPGVIDQGLVPFPDGEAITGSIYGEYWKEYIGTCLNDTMFAGNCYQLSFYIASTPLSEVALTCNNGMIYYGDVAVTLFGNPSCAELPFDGVQCPPVADGWVELGNVNYTPSSNWELITLDFTPNTDISSIIIGSPCTLPATYADSLFNPACIPYFVYDKLILKEGCGYQLDINNSYDQPCANNSQLSAFTNLPSGTYQWYFNGVALVGQTDSILSLNSQNNQNGSYTVILNTGANCYGSTYMVNYFPPDQTFIEAIGCGSYFWSATTTSYYEDGNYQTTLESLKGCDSVVNLSLVISTDIYVNIDTTICAGDTLIVQGLEYSSPGNYQQYLTTALGCDSVLNINLTVVDSITEPKIYYTPPECLNGPITVKTEPAPIYDLTWTLPSGEIVQGDSIIVDFTDSNFGTYSLTEGATGCISGSDSFELDDSFESILLEGIILPNVYYT